MARKATAKLAKYRAKRDFAKTPEPSGTRARVHGRASFVIQKHAARRLHYDFRLELDGVLLSWSVPKGPSLDPSEKRLAVHVEDHPLDYADFEGVIPKGQYGGGTVVVWDRGTWEPEGDAAATMAKGKLTFTLHGDKLHGKWHLVRTKPSGGKDENWLLFKSRDEAANDKLEIVESEPRSVVSGRTIDEVAAAPDDVWQSNRQAEPSVTEKRTARILSSVPASPAALVAQLPLGFALTNLDKVLYPESGLTKGQLAAYLAVVADYALPHIANRLLTLVRCPDGRGGQCFFQKHVLKGAPAAIDKIPLTEQSGDDEIYMAIHDLAGLVAPAQLGALELHTWGSHIDNVERPDLIVFDLDPDVGLDRDRVALAAIELRKLLGELELDSFVKTTGGKGLHVTVPVQPKLDWNEIKAFAKSVGEMMVQRYPTSFTTNMAKARRKDRIFIDYLRNGRGATFIAPYSARARAGATVATPITWDELARGVDPAAFTITTIPKRLADEGDPWRELSGSRRPITAAARRAVGGTP